MYFIFSHAVWGSPRVAAWATKVAYVGTLGLELFFVLSGFLIGGLLIERVLAGHLRTWGDLAHFWGRRWLRTLPLYYLFLFIYYFYEHGDLNLLQGHLKFVFFLQNFASRGSDFFRLAWSLCVEEHFYVFFPLLCFILARWSSRSLRGFLAASALFLLIPLLLRVAVPADNELSDFDWKLRQVTLLRLDSLIYGVGMAFVFKLLPRVWDRLRSSPTFGFLLIAGASLWLYIDYPSLFGSRWVQVFYYPLTGLGFALVLPWFYAMKRPSSPRVAAAVTYLSTISYSLYLSHVWLFSVTKGALKHLAAGRALLEQPVFIVPFLLLLSLPVGAFFYHCWECPFLWLRARWVPNERGGPVGAPALPSEPIGAARAELGRRY